MAEKLIVRIGSNTAGFESGLRKAGQSVKKWAKRATIALTAVVTVSALIGSKFEQSLRLAGAIAGATGKDFAALEKEARRLGKTTAFTATQAAEGMTNLARTGLKTQEIIKTTGIALEFAGAHATDMENSTRILAAAMNVFEIESEGARRVADTFTFALDNSLLRVDSLREGMKNASAMGAVLGQSIEESTTALAFFVNMGLEGSRAGMQFRMAMQAMVKQGPGVRRALKAMNLEFEDINPLTHNFGETLQFVADKIPATAEGLQHSIGLFGRAGTFMFALGKKVRGSTLDFDDFVKKMKESQTEAGITARRYADMMDTFRGQWKILWSAIQELGLSVFSVYKDQGKIVFKFLADNVVKMADFINKNRFVIMTAILETSQTLLSKFDSVIMAVGQVVAAFAFAFAEVKRVFFGKFSESFKTHILEPLGVAKKWLKEKFHVAWKFYFGKQGLVTKVSEDFNKGFSKESKEAYIETLKEFKKFAGKNVALQKKLSKEIARLKEQEAKRITDLELEKIEAAKKAAKKITEDATGAARKVSVAYGDSMLAIQGDNDDMVQNWGDSMVDMAQDGASMGANIEDTFSQFFVGVGQGFGELTEDQKEWADHGRRSAREFASDASNSIANFINPLKDDFLEIDSLFESMLESMVGSLTRSVADMAVQWGIGAISRAGASFGWWDSGAWKIARDQMGMVHKDEMIVPAETARVLRGEGTGPTFSADTAFGGRNPEFAKDFAIGAMKTHGLYSLEGLGHYIAKNISLDRLIQGVFDPRAIMGNTMVGGMTNAVPNALGLSGKWADLGQTLLGFAGGMSLGPIGAIAGAIGGAGIFDAIGDVLNMRENEITRDFLEALHGRVKGGRVYAGLPGYVDYESVAAGLGEGAGGGISGGEFGGGMAGMTAHGGWAHGPESGYKQTLHGSEYILNEDQFKAVRELNAGGGRGQTIRIGSLIKIEGNLIADQATFDDFIVKINDALFKFAEMGY